MTPDQSDREVSPPIQPEGIRPKGSAAEQRARDAQSGGFTYAQVSAQFKFTMVAVVVVVALLAAASSIKNTVCDASRAAAGVTGWQELRRSADALPAGKMAIVEAQFGLGGFMGELAIDQQEQSWMDAKEISQDVWNRATETERRKYIRVTDQAAEAQVRLWTTVADRAKTKATLTYVGMLLAVVLALIASLRPRLSLYRGMERPGPLLTQTRVLAGVGGVGATLSAAAYFATKDADLFCPLGNQSAVYTFLAASAVAAGLLILMGIQQWRAGNSFRNRDPELFVPWALGTQTNRGSAIRSQLETELRAAQDYVSTLKQNNVTAGLQDAEAAVAKIQERMKSVSRPPSAENVARIQKALTEKRTSLEVLKKNRAASEAMDSILADIKELRRELGDVAKALEVHSST